MIDDFRLRGNDTLAIHALKASPQGERPQPTVSTAGYVRSSLRNWWGRCGEYSCKTNPILRATPGGTGPQGHGRRGKCAKRTQFPAVPGGSGPGGRESWRAIVPNEANLGRSLKVEVSSVKTGKVVVGASNFALYPSSSAEGRSCKTKPISVGAELELNHLRKKSYAVCTCLIGSAKQSQFSPRCRSGDRRSRGRNVQNEANLGSSGGDRVPPRLAPKGSCTNKANVPVRPEMGAGGCPCDANRAKQSQFVPRCRSGDRRSRGPCVRNKANFARPDTGDKLFKKKELCGFCPLLHP